MTDNNYSNNHTESRFDTLLNNAGAARAIAKAVEGTIGPKGLDTMMIDNMGEVVVTNDGVTILKLMEVSHPVAHMIINTARAQQTEMGDGTTTATIIAGALITEGAEKIVKGVPVSKVIVGINLGIERAISLLHELGRPVTALDDRLLYDIAGIASRGHQDITRLIIAGAQELDATIMNDRDYKFPEAVIAKEYAGNEVKCGVLINQQPLNSDMPSVLSQARILVIDDALRPEEVEGHALGTDAGFKHYLQSLERFKVNLEKCIDLGINVIVVNGGVDNTAEQILSQAGVIVIPRVPVREMERLCLHTGARKIKRSALNSDKKLLQTCIGEAGQVIADEKLEHTYVLQGKGKKWVTLLIGAATEEVADERERMAKDAAAAVQASIKGGIVPGGGAAEVWIARQLEDMAGDFPGMESQGVLCVKEALLQPFRSMALNAGFNPLEKLAQVNMAQKKNHSAGFSFNSDNGEIIDTFAQGILDPLLIKAYAFKAAGEVAAAVLRIDSVIKMRQAGLAINENILE